MRARQSGNLSTMLSLGLTAPARREKKLRRCAIHKVDK